MKTVKKEELDLEAQLAALNAILGERLPDMEALRREEARSGERGDQALALVNMATQVVLLDGDRIKRMLAQAAKSKIADGTYCICSSCDRPIAPIRLIRTPQAILCVSCQEQREDGTLENDPLARLFA
jgi:DnaK suppressor protein